MTKGWFNESSRHSFARKAGKAGPVYKSTGKKFNATLRIPNNKLLGTKLDFQLKTFNKLLRTPGKKDSAYNLTKKIWKEKMRTKEPITYHGRTGKPVIHRVFGAEIERDDKGRKYIMVRKEGGGVKRLYEGSKYKTNGKVKKLDLSRDHRKRILKMDEKSMLRRIRGRKAYPFKGSEFKKLIRKVHIPRSFVQRSKIKTFTVFEAGYGSPGAEKYITKANSGKEAIQKIFLGKAKQRGFASDELFAVQGEGERAENKFYEGKGLYHKGKYYRKW